MKTKNIATILVMTTAMFAMPVTAAFAKTRAIIVNGTNKEITVDGKKTRLAPGESTWDTLGSVISVLNEGGAPDIIRIKDSGRSNCSGRRTYKMEVVGSSSAPKILASSTCIKLRVAQVGCIFAVVMWNEELKTYRVDMDRTERKQCKSKWFEDGGRDRISKSVDKGLKWQENAAEILTAVAALKN